jgi:hypothetical protein
MAYRIIQGVGVNDADYVVNKTDSQGRRVRCPFYVKWAAMLERCYSESFHKTNPSYVGCSAHPNWHLFSNFKRWMEQQDWEGKQLDKDLLIINNKIYSPETCVFVSGAVNNFTLDGGNQKSGLPMGVSLDKSYVPLMYKAQCRSVISGKNETVGRSPNPYIAHKAWLAAKLEQAYILAAQQTDERVAKALIDRYEHYKEYFG